MAPVHEAAAWNDVEGLRAMLDAEPGLIEAEDVEWQHTRPLYYACRMGHVEAVQLLLDRGAPIDGEDMRGMTPLMHVCQAGLVEVAALLLSRGADPSLGDHVGGTALMHASMWRGAESSYVAVIRLLLKDGRVMINAQNRWGCTALWYACESGLEDRARVLLLEGGADHTIRNRIRNPWDKTAKGAAAGNSHWDTVRLLEWYEDELQKPYLLSKARAVVDATESISKAPEKVGTKTEAEAQKAREEAAPAYLRGRVVKGQALLVVEVVGQEVRWEAEEEGRAVCEFMVKDLKEDLLLELMEGLTYRRWVPEEE